MNIQKKNKYTIEITRDKE